MTSLSTDFSALLMK
ncbi:BnaC05g48030D [Brassica napus]|uniref:BnaC05g48030D protein n=1 Tax=Brassica napus TaxID=3708 RepID=A0A078INK2_BRANA|nr:BnaC05g48030D [Brassica napus]